MRLEGKVLYMPVLYYKVKLTMYTGGATRLCTYMQCEKILTAFCIYRQLHM